jgi:AcrR family transcriptional regulator
MSTRKAQQSEATRDELIAVARRHFAEKGYADTATEDLVRAAGMTRGALYHHFKDKKDLFRAVVETVEGELGPRIMAAAKPGADAWSFLLGAIDTYLDACLERDIQQIILIDGPSVLGWDDWREIEEKYGLSLVAGGLTAAMAQGFIKEQPVGPLAHLVLAAVNEAGLVIARSDDVAAARAEVGGALNRLLEGLQKERR